MNKELNRKIKAISLFVRLEKVERKKIESRFKNWNLRGSNFRVNTVIFLMLQNGILEEKYINVFELSEREIEFRKLKRSDSCLQLDIDFETLKCKSIVIK